MLSMKHQKWTASWLTKEAVKKGLPTTNPSTVWHMLHHGSYYQWHSRKASHFTPLRKKKQLAFCLAHQDFDWGNILFTDKRYCKIHQNKRLMWGKKRPHVPTEQHPLSLMIWGGISKCGVTE